METFGGPGRNGEAVNITPLAGHLNDGALNKERLSNSLVYPEWEFILGMK